jgi:hypothetical protein
VEELEKALGAVEDVGVPLGAVEELGGASSPLLGC